MIPATHTAQRRRPSVLPPDYLPPRTRVLAWRLLEGRRVAPTELVDAMYGDRADGGPDNVRSSIAVCVHVVRRWLRHHGVVLHGSRRLGWYVLSADAPRMQAALVDMLDRYPLVRPKGPRRA